MMECGDDNCLTDSEFGEIKKQRLFLKFCVEFIFTRYIKRFSGAGFLIFVMLCAPFVAEDMAMTQANLVRFRAVLLPIQSLSWQ